MRRDDMLPIGDVATRSGLATSAIRFYEAEGLISSTRSPAGQRRFARHTLRRLAFIRAAQRVGLSLADVAGALRTLPDDRAPTKAEWARLPARGAVVSTNASSTSSVCVTISPAASAAAASHSPRAVCTTPTTQPPATVQALGSSWATTPTPSSNRACDRPAFARYSCTEPTATEPSRQPTFDVTDHAGAGAGAGRVARSLDHEPQVVDQAHGSLHAGRRGAEENVATRGAHGHTTASAITPAGRPRGGGTR